MKEFKVGDKVFDLRFGNGVVEQMFDAGMYDIRVKFGDSADGFYHANGKDSEDDLAPILYHGHDLIVEVKEPEYEWQVAFKNNGRWHMAEQYFKSKDAFIGYVADNIEIQDCELFEPSKRLVKRG